MGFDAQNMTVEEAQNFIRDITLKDIAHTALASALMGASARAALAIPGQLNYQQARAKARRRAMRTPPTEFELPTTKGASEKPPAYSSNAYSWPAPYYPLGLASLLVPPLLGYGAVSQLIKYRRQKADRAERQRAESAFEDALRAERISAKTAGDAADIEKQFADALAETPVTKFAQMLDEVADKFVCGELPNTPKSAATFSEAIPGTALNVAALAALLGAYTGWRIHGKSDEQRDVEAYLADKYRKQLARPAPVQVDIEKQAGAFTSPAAWRELATAAGSSLLGGLGTSWLLTNTKPGRSYLAARSADVMSDPEFVNGQLDRIFSNPHMMEQLYARMMPAFKQQFMRQHPRLAQFAGHFGM